MRSNKRSIQLIVLAFALALSGAVYGQDGNASSQPQGAGDTTQTRVIGEGQQLKIEGIVVKRNPDTFTLRGSDGTETVVALTDKTSVKTVRKGLFRRDRDSGVSYILRGLRLKAEGRGNADGQLVAEDIRFDEQDLRTAQALESRVDPVETLAVSTRALAEDNQQRIGEAEQNAQRLAGQVDELSSVANAAGAAAQNAQVTADHAQSDASNANERINGLDDYEVFKTVTVHFKPGSAVLSLAAKDEIDEAAASVRGESLKGWMVAVVGYADSTGKTAKNRSLSERRANAVINYLVTTYDLPMRRLVQPFGYGSSNPVATNDTREGRTMNRRAEIKVLVNKGISSKGDSTQAASEN
jgi:outer membrane protein OmpA-like peptidoglycan-associated protein